VPATGREFGAAAGHWPAAALFGTIDGMGESPQSPREQGFSRDADKLIRRLARGLPAAAAGKATAQQIRERVEGYPLMTDEAFKRRFHEDRAELAELGIVIRRDFDEEAGTEAYSLHPSSYHLPPIDLTDDEISALAACLFVLQDRFAFSQPLRLALLSLAHGRPELLAEAGAPPLAIVASGGAPASSCSPARAAGRAQDGRLDYYAIERDETLTRTVDPTACCSSATSGTCRVVPPARGGAHLPPSASARAWHATRAPHDFAPPSRFELADYLDRAPWQLGGVRGEAGVRIDGDMAWWVEAHFAGNGTLEHLPDGALRFTTAYSSGPQLVNWVLGLGEAAELEAPTELRSLLVTQLNLLRRRLEVPPAVDEARPSGPRPGPPAPRRDGRGRAKSGTKGRDRKDRARAAATTARRADCPRASTLLTYLLRSC
jgi:predicted DNA-binding transcriptional regulator YafY